MTCECCGTTKDIAGVACSSLGAISLCYCRACAENGAEPKSMIEWCIDDCGGLENVSDEIKNHVTYFEDGQYHKMVDFNKTLPVGK